MNNTVSYTIAIIGLFSTMLGIYVQLRKLRSENEEKKKKEEQKEENVLKMLDNDKQRLNKLEDGLSDIKDHLGFQSDMIYQMLDHMASNNNSGGMKDALDRYNQHFRRNL